MDGKEKMNWTNVKERLPSPGVYVLVAKFDSRTNVKMHFIEIAERIENRWFDGKDGDEISNKYSKITHWMPLPEPPDQEDD